MKKPVFWYSKRHKIAKEFEDWCKDNNADVNDRTNFVTWLYLNDLLDMNKIEKFLENNKDKSEEDEKEN